MSEDVHQLDRAARTRALDTDRSFIIQAPAGSGKTELLIQRFLALLARVAAPEEVVAITFTRKAAGEMRNRIIGALAAKRAGTVATSNHEEVTLALAAAALERDAERDWGLTENPGRLRIQTIDSLCYSLSSQMPLLSGMGTTPDPQDDATALYREAARETLAQLEDPVWFHQVAALLRHVDNDTARAEGLVARLLSRRDQWIRHHQRFDREQFTRSLANLVRDRLEQAHSAVAEPVVSDLLFCARYAASILGAQSPLRSIADLGKLPGVEPDQLEAWQALARLFLTGKGELRRRVDIGMGFPPSGDRAISAAEGERRTQAKRRMEELLKLVGETPGLVDALAEVRLLPPPQYSDEQWRLIESLSPLLKLALAQLELVFRGRRAVDFPQLLIAANQALGEPDAPTDLALAVDYRIRHLLVDEFQDTSLSQYDLLRRLTAGWQPGDGRTLFAVGDPMQSIYRFREADVGLFLRARREGIGTVPLEPLALTLNFRSQAGIVDWVNHVFSTLLPAREDLASGAVPYSASLATGAGSAGKPVQVHALAGEDRTAEARRVVELIRAAQSEDAAHCIAILVRSRTHLSAIVPALKQAGLRFRAIEIESLAHRPAVQDLHALTRALLHPADRVAWLSVLRAPWCGLTLLDLERLAGNARDGVLWKRMTDADIVQALSVDGQARLGRAVAALAPTLEHRGRGSLRRRIEGAWMRLGGPASVQDDTDLEDVQVYLNLVEALEQGGDLEHLEALEQELTELYAVPDVQARDTLQVMTIHKAKGLEFDVVILPGLASITGRDDPELLRWIERPRANGESDLLLAAITASGNHDDPIYAMVTRLLNERQDHEDGRLLYVAATRARKHLHLVAQVKIDDATPGEPTALAPPKGTLLCKLWPAVKSEVQRAVADAGPAISHDASHTLDPMMYPLRRLPVEWTVPSPPPAVPWRQLEREEDMSDTVVEFSWVGESARHVGTVVHLFLQRIAEDGLAAWDTHRIDSVDGVLRLALKQEGVPVSELDAAHRRVKQALLGVLADPRARWILDDVHQDARSEYRLTGELEGVFVNVALDRTFVDQAGVRWIVDYKTGVHEGGELEAFLDRERERYREQLERYAALLSRVEPRVIRLGLYFPLLNGWREWQAGG